MSMKPSNISISRILMISYGIVIALFALTKMVVGGAESKIAQ